MTEKSAEPDQISRFGRYWYIRKTQILADRPSQYISLSLLFIYILLKKLKTFKRQKLKFTKFNNFDYANIEIELGFALANSEYNSKPQQNLLSQN